MARNLLQVESLAKVIGGRTLFEGVAFQADAGDRVALIGPNGCGKTTLLSLLSGRSTADHGRIRIPPHVRVVLLDQHPTYPKGAKVRDVVAGDNSIPPELAQELAALESRMADPALYESGEADAVISRYGDVQREAQMAKASASQGIEDSPILNDLGFGPEDMDQAVDTLSGGERTRLFLARTITAADPNTILILDEPTNHLDVETMEWLEEWAAKFEGVLLVTSHDRAFLDNVATRVFAFERGTLQQYVGNYTEYERRFEEDQVRLAALRERESKELDRQKAVIEQFKQQKRFNGQMASRLTGLQKYRSAIDKTPDPVIEKVAFSVGFGEAEKSSNDVMRVRGLAKQYGDRVLFYDLSLDVKKGDRIGLIGANGVGKTTLLKILTGRETKDLGNIEVAPGVRGAYYAQGQENLDPTRSLRDEVLSARKHLEDPDVRALLGRFGFRGEHDPSRKVSSLSGGERARLAILKIVIGPSNLLILDEPTNHFDIQSRRVLVSALNAYKGALIVVSHDRWFLDSIVNQVAVLARRNVKMFAGDWTTARTAAAMEEFSVETAKPFIVRKAFKDYEDGVKHTAGAVLKLTPADFAEKRVLRTALQMGWLEED